MLSPYKGITESRGAPSSENKPSSHLISLQEDDKDRSSASLKDLDTTSCFLHFQETGKSLKKIHHPVKDLQVSGQLA